MSIILKQIGKGYKQIKNCFSSRADSDGTIQNNSYCPDTIPSDDKKPDAKSLDSGKSESTKSTKSDKPVTQRRKAESKKKTIAAPNTGAWLESIAEFFRRMLALIGVARQYNTAVP